MTQKTCKIPDCASPATTREMCNMHALRVKRYGDPHFVKKLSRRPSDTCSQPGCDRPYFGKGLCKLHYTRQEHGQHGLEPKKCEVCGKDTPRTDARFCGNACQMKWHRQFGCYRKEVTKESYGTCSIEGCEDVVKAHGMCTAHCQKQWRYGDPLIDRAPKDAKCSTCGIGCTVQYGSEPYCPKHYHNAYYYANHKVEKARRNARRSRMKVATPPWADLKAIQAFYFACPDGMEVDHALPLKGKRVSGLHIRENLQYLPVSQNRRKSNSHPD